MSTSSLYDRMKMYEGVSRTFLTPKVPAIIRVDGRAFHTFLDGFKKPFDDFFVAAMQDTMKYMSQNIQGCVLGYVQSDEISLLLVDYESIDSEAFFGYNVQKCVSIAASMATMAFNRALADRTADAIERYRTYTRYPSEEDVRYYETLICRLETGAMFDARIFSLPKEEVCNYFLSRQQDATRNSINMVARTYFSHSELNGINTDQAQDMLFRKFGVNWNDFPTHLKRGSCCVRVPIEGKPRPQWRVDKEIPIFKGEGRSYIEDRALIAAND